ncbi:hypothetical protein D3C76_1533010 [compost metagenome]
MVAEVFNLRMEFRRTLFQYRLESALTQGKARIAFSVAGFLVMKHNFAGIAEYPAVLQHLQVLILISLDRLVFSVR